MTKYDEIADIGSEIPIELRGLPLPMAVRELVAQRDAARAAALELDTQNSHLKLQLGDGQ